MINKNDIFVIFKNNPKDLIYIISFFILLAPVFIFNFIQSGSTRSFGSIYLPIFLFTFIILLIAYVSGGKITNEVIFGKIITKKQLYLSLLVGLGVGLILISNIFITNTSLSFLSMFRPALPYAISTTTGLSLFGLIIVGFIAPEIEESFRASALVPTFTKVKMPILFIFTGVLLLAIPQLIFLSLILISLAIIFGFSKLFLRKEINNMFSKHLVSIFISAILFGLLHIYAYGSTTDPMTLMLSAMGFAILVDIINWFMQNAIASRITHSITNSILYCFMASISYTLGFAVVLLYMIIIILVFNKGSFIGTNLSSLNFKKVNISNQ